MCLPYLHDLRPRDTGETMQQQYKFQGSLSCLEWDLAHDIHCSRLSAILLSYEIHVAQSRFRIPI